MKILFLFVTSFLFLSCAKNSGSIESTLPGESDSSSLENLNIQTNSFTEIDSTGVLIFPLEMGQNKRNDNSYGYKEMPENQYWNILFLNSNTNEYHLLTEEKVVVLNYDFNYNAEDGRGKTKNAKHIFYNIRSKDYNKDKMITDDDPVYLYVSDRFGKNFRQISPLDYSLNYWEYIESSNKVIMTLTKDSNRNKLFDEKDEVLTFETVLDEAEKPREVFKPELKEKLKKLYDRDWKNIK
ncbi:hypothetical protein LNP04_09535 [Chryseobacterium sp. C-71]|uniref:hypothetical protein n=1 Tax=Chryseobacterium sp. C-71 TaxID=2893882 RepID=UPI001E309897|nr:hypothetical protein [Chryseobacterium sp. C-71]UFH33918.1 hypothetical protein LNP04_09535 [Chryseobacterium sp. C-71]